MTDERLRYIQAVTRGYGKTRSNTHGKDIDPKIKQLFEKYDSDNSGEISAVEMRGILKSWGIDHTSMVAMFMRRDPKSAKGYKLNLSEFNDFMCFYDAVKESYKAFTSGNHLTEVELKTYLSNFSYNFEAQALSTFLEIFDANKNGVLEVGEVFKLLIFLNRLEHLFQIADRDRNNKLDEAELRSLLGAMGYPISTYELKVLFDMLSADIKNHMDFSGFVKCILFLRDNLNVIRTKGKILRAQNRKPKKLGKEFTSPTTKRAIQEVVRSRQIDIQTIVAECRRSGTKWEDPDFSPSVERMFPDNIERSQPYLQWRRPEEFTSNPSLFVDSIDSGEVVQGYLGDCYLLSAFSVLATRTNELENLFTASYPDLGIYQCRFFKNNEWHLVTIDDRIPTTIMGEVVFSRCRDPSEMWCALVEKAYAKLHGCYGAIETGDVSEALVDLTSEPAMLVMDLDGSSKLWKRLLHYFEEGYLMGCVLESDEEDREYSVKMTPEGLLYNHAYAILHIEQVHGYKLMRLRNPWGNSEWTGPWSDGSKEWTPELLKHFNYSFCDDGTFFMEFHDWCENFTRSVMVWTVSNKFDLYPCEGVWQKPDLAGGSLNHQTWMNNPQFKLTVKQRCRVFIALVHEDRRLRDHASSTYESAGITVLKRARDSNFKQKTIESRKDVKSISLFVTARGAACAFMAKPDQPYTVIFSTFVPDYEGNWFGVIATKSTASVMPLITAPPAVTVKGSWFGQTAGGCPNWNTWHTNQQFILTVREKVKADITILQPRAEGFAFVGFHIFPADPERYSVHDPTTKIFEAKYQNASTNTHNVKLKPGVYNIVPATFTPGVHQTFGLAVQAHGCTLAPVTEDWRETRLLGRWIGPHLNGGCHNNSNPDYKKNPRISFQVETPFDGYIVPQESEVRGIGFYIFESKSGFGSLTNRIYCSNFTTEKENSKRVHLEPGTYICLPVTYVKSVESQFEVIVWSNQDIKLNNLDESASESQSTHY